MNPHIVTVSDRPDLAPLVARWRVDAFANHPGGYTVEELTALILAPPVGPEENFVLFDGDEPVGTAGIASYDLDARPDLAPWLVGVFVQPALRGRGHAAALVRRVEAFAQETSVPVLWLYTATADRLYARLGWRHVGMEQDGGHAVVLMRRDLSGS
jgi:GNAT superfamily N-acetyltransferase